MNSRVCSVKPQPADSNSYRKSIVRPLEKEAIWGLLKSIGGAIKAHPRLSLGLGAAGGAAGLALSYPYYFLWPWESKPGYEHFSLMPDPNAVVQVGPGRFMHGARIHVGPGYYKALSDVRTAHQKRMELEQAINPLNLVRYLNPEYVTYSFQQVGNRITPVPYFSVPSWFGRKWVPLTFENLVRYGKPYPLSPSYFRTPAYLAPGAPAQIKLLEKQKKLLERDYHMATRAFPGQTIYDPATGNITDLFGNVVTPDNQFYQYNFRTSNEPVRSAVPMDIRGGTALPLVY